MHDLMEVERPPLSEVAPVMLDEARRRLWPLTLIFVAIAVAALLAGTLWPRKYFASTSILISDDTIVQKLLEGRAVPTSVSDRALIAREVAFSRKVINDILGFGGWLDDKPTPAEQDLLGEALKARTTISVPRENLIQFQYWDVEPERAYAITQRFAELFMAESRSAKLRESQEAFDFISGQVAQYRDKLLAAENKLRAFREKQPEARPGTAVDVNARIVELRRQIETGRLEQMELRSREAALQQQLGQEASTISVQGRQGQLQLRLAELQQELDRLRLSFTPKHPDVVRTRHQIEDLRGELERLQKTAIPANDDLVRSNPLHIELRSRLDGVRRDQAAIASRIAASEAMLAGELERSRRVADSETDLAELTRDYEVNREIYQDLLERQENARLSLSLDQESRGETFRVQEPAALPTRPSGLRLLHFAIGGLLAAVLTPFGLLWVQMKLDPRVRSPRQLEREIGLPVVLTLPTYRNADDHRRFRLQARRSLLLIALTIVAYLAVGLIFLLGAP